MRPQDVSLVDASGQPFDDRLHDALITVAPRLQREFLALADASVLSEVLEETGNRLAAREGRKGAVRELKTYAYVVARRIANLRTRLDQWELRTSSLNGETVTNGQAVSANGWGTLEDIEDTILAKELAARLPEALRREYALRYMGLSTDEIAVREGTSTVNVESRWRQVKRKLRRLIHRPRSPAATTGA